MGAVFNADEILEIGERIERNGAGFYRKAAEGAAGDTARDMLLELADMEDGHVKVFAAMREEFPSGGLDAAAFDPLGEAAMYLRAFADGHVFDTRTDPSEKLSGDETVEEILKTALGMETSSIAFFLGVRDMVPARLGKDKIDGIIAEERSHVVLISGKLASL